MAHDHSHDHSHSHSHSHSSSGKGAAFGWGIGLNSLIVALEAGFGWWVGSLSLMADAGHNLADVLGLVMAWGAYRLARRPPSERFSFGMRRSTILAALFNALLLLVGVGALAWEAVGRLLSHAPGPRDPWVIIGVAAAGLVINGGTALLFKGHGHDLNMQGAFLHLLSDAAVALGVVVGGVVILKTGWIWVDPVVTLLISVAITLGTWGLLMDSIRLSLDAVPQGLDLESIRQALLGIDGVQSVHDLHVWPLSTEEVALTVHLVRPEPATDEFLHRVADLLKERFSIGHATVQVEQQESSCSCTLEGAG